LRGRERNQRGEENLVDPKERKLFSEIKDRIKDKEEGRSNKGGVKEEARKGEKIISTWEYNTVLDGRREIW